MRVLVRDHLAIATVVHVVKVTARATEKAHSVPEPVLNLAHLRTSVMLKGKEQDRHRQESKEKKTTKGIKKMIEITTEKEPRADQGHPKGGVNRHPDPVLDHRVSAADHDHGVLLQDEGVEEDIWIEEMMKMATDSMLQILMSVQIRKI